MPLGALASSTVLIRVRYLTQFTDIYDSGSDTGEPGAIFHASPRAKLSELVLGPGTADIAVPKHPKFSEYTIIM
jgi:hypothetical protein